MAKPPADRRERALARYELERRRARGELVRYVPFITAGYEPPEPLGELCEVFDRIQAGEQVFATCGAPPRHGKTDTVFHGVARFLGEFSARLVAYCTYSADIARDQSRRARETAARAGVLVSDERDLSDRFNPAASVRYWQTEQGGGFLAVGRKGAIVGRGPHLLIVDDPYRDRDEAESPAASEDVWDWYQGTLFPRREPGASVLVFHQRWNDRDLIARIKAQAEKPDYKGPSWRHISLPAIRSDGAPLWPSRYTGADLEVIRAEVGEYNWWSQFMQAPIPKGGRQFGDPVRGERPERRMHVLISVDPAGTRKTSADHTAIVIAWAWKERDGHGVVRTHLFVERVIRERLEIPETVEKLLELAADYPGAPIVIETQGGHGQAVAQSLRRLDERLNLVEISTTSEKFIRWQPCVAAWRRGRIVVPPRELEDQPPWIAAYLDEMKRVTGIADREDDQADATSQAYDYADTIGFDEAAEASDERQANDLGGY